MCIKKIIKDEISQDLFVMYSIESLVFLSLLKNFIKITTIEQIIINESGKPKLCAISRAIL